MMNHYPPVWHSDRLKDVAVINGSALPANTDPEYVFDYLEISNVDYYGVVDPQAMERLRFEDAPSRARRRVGNNNTVISSVRPNLQAIAFLPDCQDNLVCSTGFNVVQPHGAKLHSKFAYYTLISEDARQYFEAAAKGVGYPAIDDKDFNSFAIYIPPLHEQEHIASYLEASCAAIDAAIAAKREQLGTLDEIRKRTLHDAFSNEDWPLERLKDIAVKISSGVTPDGGAAGYLVEGIPLLRSQNVHFDGLRLDDVAFIDAETHASMKGSQLKPKDVLINITGASIGRCTFVPETFGEGNVNQHVCFIRGNHRVDHRYLAAFLASPKGQGRVFSTFTGASRQGLSHKDLGVIQIPLPAIEKQRDIVSKLEVMEAQRKELYANLESQITTLIDYRKSLIHECVTGQRRITAEDVSRVKNLQA